MNKLYGFEGEVTKKCAANEPANADSECSARLIQADADASVRYDEELYQLFCEAFCLLPLCHVINNQASP